MQNSTIHVTGANEAYFPMICMLLESHAEFSNGHKLWVCDFGLSNEQQLFLKKEDVLLARPPTLAAGLHPFYYKASLSEYLQDVDFETLLWLDADCLIVGPLDDLLQELPENCHNSEFVAVCRDSCGNIENFLCGCADNGRNARPFEDIMRNNSLPITVPYLNSGIFLARSNKLLVDWFTATFRIEFHVLFEQNMFNYVAYRNQIPVFLLSEERINVHGNGLNRLGVSGAKHDGTKDVFLDNHRVLIVHATSANGTASLRCSLDINVGKLETKGTVNLIHNDCIRMLQMEYMSRYMRRKRDLLIECGVARRQRLG